MFFVTTEIFEWIKLFIHYSSVLTDCQLWFESAWNICEWGVKSPEQLPNLSPHVCCAYVLLTNDYDYDTYYTI